MPNQQGLSPFAVRRCGEGISRVLYINLGNNQDNRSNRKAALHPLLCGLGWTPPPGRGEGPRTMSLHYFIRADGTTDKELAKQVQNTLTRLGDQGFEFAIFKPVYTDDNEDDFEAFKRVFGTNE
ncbi:hypothetical protein L5515_004976 [Caenorhabditis briggsae]|uniref:Uncharacterized protein n=1 Tax=Caenorhabditis briggsae TaxID=6238 RepID=A0AAE9JBT0_CAEBR|nr:hypothetical protein L5515_004976 [Caenorhabditis briggsae]